MRINETMISLRIDEKTAARLADLATRQRKSRSEFLRDIIHCVVQPAVEAPQAEQGLVELELRESIPDGPRLPPPEATPRELIALARRTIAYTEALLRLAEKRGDGNGR